MKNIFLLVIISIVCLTSLMANNNLTVPVNIFKTENVSVTTENAEVFEYVNFDADRENFEFTTTETISYIQIFNDAGELEFQLPVMSNKVTIGKSIFGNGEYTIGFMVEGIKDIQFTQLSIGR